MNGTNNLPRTRGDKPEVIKVDDEITPSTPHTRG